IQKRVHGGAWPHVGDRGERALRAAQYEQIVVDERKLAVRIRRGRHWAALPPERSTCSTPAGLIWVRTASRLSAERLQRAIARGLRPITPTTSSSSSPWW